MAAPQEPAENDGPSALGAAAGLAAGAGMAAALAGGDDAGADAPEAPELKLDPEELSAPEAVEDDDLVTDEINLDGLDLLLEDEPLPSGPEPEDEFKTEELNLADLEKMLDGDEGEKTAPTEPPESSALDDLNAFQEETEDSIIEDLDLDMDDLESLLDEDTDLGAGLEAPDQPAGAADAIEDEVKLEMAPELEDILNDDVEDIGIDETEEIGLAEIEDADSQAPVGDGLGDDDMDLELAPGIDSLFDEVEDQDVPLEETEELDFAALGDDIGEMAPVAGEPVATPPIEDDDLDLGLAPVDEEPAPSAEAVEELDLGDLESVLEAGTTDPSKLSPGEEQPELVLELEGDTAEPADVADMDLDLDDLDLGASEASAPDDIEETRELELDELESLLDSADTPPAVEAPEAEGLELDLDLEDAAGDDDGEPEDATRELNLDDIEKILESQEPAAATAADDAEMPDDLELDLDIGDAEAAAPAEADLLGEDETTEGSDSLDLSELEKMLDVEDTTDSPSPADAEVEDLDLDFDLQPATDEGDDLELEFDMLEDEGEEPSALFDTSESEDLGLDLDIGETPAPEKVALEEDLEFEIMDEKGSGELELDIVEDVGGGGDDLDLDLLEEEGEELDLDILEDGAEDFDLDIIEDDAGAVKPAGAAGAVASRDLTQELMDEMAAADTQTMDIPPAEAKPIKPAPVPKKKKTSKSLVLLLLLVVLGGAGYYAYTATGFDFSKFKLSDLPEIPFVSKWLGVEKTPEAVVPIQETLKGSWVENKNDGRLYIIQGRVKNEYSEPRSYIRVTGRIFADGRKFKRAAQAYCGNMPSPEDLENLPLADLQKRLSNRSGAENSNVKVASGKEVPFTVIFAGLPEDVELQELAVEISGSLPATKPKSN